MRHNRNGFVLFFADNFFNRTQHTRMHLLRALAVRRVKFCRMLTEIAHDIGIIPYIFIIRPAFQHAAVYLPQPVAANRLHRQMRAHALRGLIRAPKRTGVHGIQRNMRKSFAQASRLLSSLFSQRDV